MKSLKLNALAFFLVRLLNIAFPLITGPYIARILSKENLGHFDTVNTIVQLFIPLATFGIYNYGVRSISKVKKDKNKINKLFSELFFLSITSTIITLIFYIIYVYNNQSGDIRNVLYFIMGLQILAQFLSIEWLNEAFENYSFILYKTLFIRIIMLILLFSFVKNSTDIINYTIIMTTTEILNILISFTWIKRDVKIVSTSYRKIIKLFITLIPLFLLANVNMLFTYLDRLFLTKAPKSVYVTDYVMAQNIVMIIIGVIVGTISVNIPRLSFYLGERNKKEYISLLENGSRFFIFLIAPISIGLIVIGPSLTIIYGSEKFSTAGIATSIFAARSIFYSLDIILGTHILFINGYERIITKFVFIGGFVNLISNTILYKFNIFNPEYYIATTALAEAIIFIMYTIYIKNKKIVSLKNIFKYSFRYLSISSLFFIVNFIVYKINPTSNTLNIDMYINTAIIISLCATIYITILLIIKDKTTLDTLNTIIKMFKKILNLKER